MTTLVTHKHAAGPHENGFDGCHARYGSNGMCPGIEIARWLNGLGDDDAVYSTLAHATNGKVRDNWLRESDHIVAVTPEVAKLTAEHRRLAAELRRVRKRLAEVTRG